MRRRLPRSWRPAAAALAFLLRHESALAASPGDVIVTEIMKNPAAVFDASGEWLELHNRSAAGIDLEGWTLRDLGIDAHTIQTGSSLVIAPGAYLVLGIDGDPAANGGVAVDYVYTGFLLGNMADEIILSDGGGTEIDRVAYDNGVSWPDPTGASMELSAPWLDNDDPANWCVPNPRFGSGDRGTPGGPPVAVLYAVRSGGDVLLAWKCAGPPADIDRGESLDLSDLAPHLSVPTGRSVFDLNAILAPPRLTYQVR